MLSIKQGGIKYHFLTLWYDSTWDWTQVSWAIMPMSKKSSLGFIYLLNPSMISIFKQSKAGLN